MANEEHLAQLGPGWNGWRISNPSVQPDLSGATLRGKTLRGANLRGADLYGAELTGANLAGANLAGVDFNKANLLVADLYEADLGRANLTGADLTGANLYRADPTGARLVMANLHGANLTGANLSGAIANETIFANTDLSQVRGLDEILHSGPSPIDQRTYTLAGQLPDRFLKGCGLPDQLIEYLPSLLGQAIQFYSCFVSYSSDDDAFARRLHADLQDNNVRCWFAPEDLKIGDRIRPGIEDAIRFHDKLLLILSEQSVASEWVESEVESALERERQDGGIKLFPIRLDGAVMETSAAWAADVRRKRNIGDFTNWKDHNVYQVSLERLLRDLKQDAQDA